MKVFLLLFSIFVLIPIKSKQVIKFKLDLKVKVEILKYFNPASNYIQQIENLKIPKKVIEKVKKMNIKFKRTHKEELFIIKKDDSKKKKVINAVLISLILKKKKVEFYYGKLSLSYYNHFINQGDEQRRIIIPIPIPQPPPRFREHLNKQLIKYLD